MLTTDQRAALDLVASAPIYVRPDRTVRRLGSLAAPLPPATQRAVCELWHVGLVAAPGWSGQPDTLGRLQVTERGRLEINA